tara:strand:+ start:1005 stop:1214 length:210 start_codon:yes stop_codon:yes gene_type:complete
MAYIMNGNPKDNGSIEGTLAYIDAMWKRNRDKSPYDSMSKEQFIEHWSKSEKQATKPGSISKDDAYQLL